MPKESANFKVVIVIFLVALISGCFWNYKIFGQPLIGGDEIDYDRIAQDILARGSFTYPYKMVAIEPLYFFFLTGVYGIFGHSYDLVRVIQIILFGLTCLLIYFLAKELFNQKIAFWAGFILALFYPLASYAGRLSREVFFAFLIVLFVYFWYRAWLSQKKKWFFLSGIILSLGILTNAIVLFLPLFFIINFLFVQRKKIFNKKTLINFSLFLLVFLIVFSFLMLRNVSSDIPVSVSTSKGGWVLLSRVELMEKFKGEYLNHFIGQTLGYFFVKKLDPQIDHNKVDEIFGVPTKSVYDQGMNLFEMGYSPSEINKIFSKEALIKIFKNPHFYFLSSFLEFLSLNNPMLPDLKTFKVYRAHNLFVVSHADLNEFAKWVIVLTIRFIWLIFFFFVIYGAIKVIHRDWSRFGWLILVIFYLNLFYAVLFGIPRYALPIYPFYIILFVYGLLIFMTRLGLKQSK